MSEVTISSWYGVRCIFDLGHSEFEDGQARHAYEERVTVWQADGLDEAIAFAEVEAGEYAGSMDGIYVGLAQAYKMYDDLRTGAELFSLVRLHDLDASEYLDQFFATGRERQRD